MALVVVGDGAAASALMAAARGAGLEVNAEPIAPAAALNGGLPADVTQVLLAPASLSREVVAETALACTAQGLSVWLDLTELPELRDLLPAVVIGDRVGVELVRTPAEQAMRRVIDVVVAGVAIMFLIPLLLLLAVLVKLSSRGPVLHRAIVVGKDGRPFSWYKFRTMRLVGEDEKLRRQRFAEFVQGGETPTKIVDHSRVTGIGRLLRRHSLDELPQLSSVLKGDMTLVGPRPCLVYEYELLKPWHRKRFATRPGLTGLWQVRGRGRVHADTMAFMDICYPLGRTWRSDLRVLWETLAVVVSGRGAS